MASRNYHKNRLKERQKRKADERELTRLRRAVLAYEGVTERSAARMTLEACRAMIARGKRRHFPISPFAGLALASMAADGLTNRSR